jgi:hypothetical protein
MSVSMNFATFFGCAKALPPHISVLIRGELGIGKSEGVRLLAKHFGLKLIDKRLSQMSEGDVVGLPLMDGTTTKFCPPDWFMEACLEPRLVFLDELNRATPEVMQAAFQMVLDREHLSGWKLHPESRIYAAINTGANYQVNEMDPALLDRFFTVDLVPTVEEWIENYARANLHEYTCDFIKLNQRFLDPNNKAEASSVEPSRRSWARCDRTLAGMNLMDSPEDPLFFNLCRGFLGNEASIAFCDFVKNMDRQITALNILDEYPKYAAKIAKLGQEKWNYCISKITEHCDKIDLTDVQGDNLKAFAETLPDELVVVAWNSLIKPSLDRKDHTVRVHHALSKLILKIYREDPKKTT